MDNSKNFNYYRYTSLIKWLKIKYATRIGVCLLKGDDFLPTIRDSLLYGFGTEEFEKVLNDGIPMGGYEYRCCLQYLKKIHNYFKEIHHKKLCPPYTLEFSDTYNNIVIAPLEDCLEKVLNELGFKIVSEQLSPNSYVYEFSFK